jgi:signal transduction histidine kinase
MLYVAAAINIVLTLLTLTAYRRRMVHLWFALLTASAALWAFAINGFLFVAADVATSLIWAKLYYLAGAAIIYALLEFSLHFPRRLSIRPAVHLGLFVAFVAMSTLVLVDGGVIEGLTVESATDKVVQLNSLHYGIYVGYYALLAFVMAIAFAYGMVGLRRQHRRRMSRMLSLMVFGIGVSLCFGAWFNLVLPLFGDYGYIWAGPPFAIIFAVVSLVAIVRQGILDIRQAVARTVVYILLVGALIALYSLIVYGILGHILVPTGQGVMYAVAQVGVAVFLALTVQPMRQFFDRVTSRIFYRNAYDTEAVLDQFREIITNEVRVTSLATGVMRVLEETLRAQSISLYIYDNKRHVYEAGHRLTDRQRGIREAFAKNAPTTLPTLIDGHLLDTLPEASLRNQFAEGKVSAAVQLTVGRQRIGMLLLGEKEGGRVYDTKDRRLLATMADELVLAIQNSLRYQEIESFNTTLQQRITDATKELRASNLQLQKLDQAKDEFVSMASHQLRTPLTSVKGYISMVLEGDAGDITPMQHKLLSEAFASSERMVHLINDFLNVSRLQTGKFMLDARPIDLAKIVGQEVDSLKTTAAARQLALQYRAPSRLPVLYLDEGKIRQVVMNFLDNAIYYSREHSTIKVKVIQEAGEVLVEVHDTGIGVPLSEQAHLFSKFFRATNARRQRPDGTGVGLYLAKKVITAHGGKMIFSSVEGEGSVFGFRLPVKKLLEAPAAEADDLGNQPDKR